MMFVLQPAVYFGMYHFPGAERFSYPRLVQASNYSAQEPYSAFEVEKARDDLRDAFQPERFLQCSGRT